MMFDGLSFGSYFSSFRSQLAFLDRCWGRWSAGCTANSFGEHHSDVAFTLLIALAANQQGVGLRPGVLSAFEASELGLAGFLRRGLLTFGGRLPMQLKAGGLQLGIRPD